MRSQTCGFTQTEVAVQTNTSGDDQPYGCASLLKPLLFWAAAHLTDGVSARWVALAQPAIVESANEPAAAIWNHLGPDRLLHVLEQLAPVGWADREREDPSFGGVPVLACEVGEAYAALALRSEHGDAAAALVLGWMRQVPGEQTFGVDDVAAASLGIDAGDVAVKAGWFISPDGELRTHAVCLAKDSEQRWHCATVLTGDNLTPGQAERYLAQHQAGEPVLDWHWQRAAGRVADETAATLAGQPMADADTARGGLRAHLHLPRPHLPLRHPQRA